MTSPRATFTMLLLMMMTMLRCRLLSVRTNRSSKAGQPVAAACCRVEGTTAPATATAASGDAHHDASGSSGPLQPPATIVTSATMDRLAALEAQCRAWMGPLQGERV
jgi:hypothetical protein